MICKNDNCKKHFLPSYPGQSVCSFDCMKAAKRHGRGAKARTDDRAKMERTYYSLRESWLSRPENRMCAVKLDGCMIQATEVHHKKGREGVLLIDQSKWLPACRNCHNYITENSKWAISKGFSISRNSLADSETNN